MAGLLQATGLQVSVHPDPILVGTVRTRARPSQWGRDEPCGLRQALCFPSLSYSICKMGTKTCLPHPSRG